MRTKPLISIHAPREGSDLQCDITPVDGRGISIHAPREGSDQNVARIETHLSKFQSTLPARGATYGDNHSPPPPSISIHAPREGSDHSPRALPCISCISIHAPREGSDSHNNFYYVSPKNDFNPRSPRGERREWA